MGLNQLTWEAMGQADLASVRLLHVPIIWKAHKKEQTAAAVAHHMYARLQCCLSACRVIIQQAAACPHTTVLPPVCVVFLVSILNGTCLSLQVKAYLADPSAFASAAPAAAEAAPAAETKAAEKEEEKEEEEEEDDDMGFSLFD